MTGVYIFGPTKFGFAYEAWRATFCVNDRALRLSLWQCSREDGRRAIATLIG